MWLLIWFLLLKKSDPIDIRWNSVLTVGQAINVLKKVQELLACPSPDVCAVLSRFIIIFRLCFIFFLSFCTVYRTYSVKLQWACCLQNTGNSSMRKLENAFRRFYCMFSALHRNSDFLRSMLCKLYFDVLLTESCSVVGEQPNWKRLLPFMTISVKESSCNLFFQERIRVN